VASFEDDVGMFWTAQPKDRMRQTFGLQPLPESDWTPPTELPSLAGVKRLSFDIETRDDDLKSLGPGSRRGSYIVGLAVGTDTGQRAYMPVRHEGGGNMDEAKVRAWAKEELNAFTGEVVGAHLLYDLEFMAMPEWGVTFKNARGFHDILLAEPLIDEWRPHGYSMDDVAEYHLGENKRHEILYAWGAANGWTSESKVKANLWRAHSSFVGAYGEGDVDLPLRIFAEQEKIIQEQGLQEVYDLERGLIPILLAMRLRGVRVNVARAETVHAQLVQERDKWVEEVRRLCGKRGADIWAPDSFAQCLEDRNLPVPRTAKKGKLSVTKQWLALHQGKDILVDAIQAARRVDKVISTYTGNILRHNVHGRIYAEFPQLKGEAGGTMARFASARPNLQNQPARDEELGPMTRSIFEAEEGEDFERQDESQIEYRLLVHFASKTIHPKTKQPLNGAEEARQSYINDSKTDFHKMTAAMIGIDPNDEVLRKRVKNVNFCRVYMGGPKKIAQTAGISIEEAQSFSREYDAKLPFVRELGLLAMAMAEARGHVKTLLNRRQRFTLFEPNDRATPGQDSKADRKKRMRLYDEAVTLYGGEGNIRRAFCHAALNRILQGSAADVLKKALKDTWDSGVCDALGAPLITVHDENDWSVPRTAQAQEAIKHARHIMESTVDLNVPLRVDWKRGANWGECV